MDIKKQNLFIDLFIVVFSVAVAIILTKTDVIGRVLTATRGLEIFSSFMAGIFFVSVFTVAPATVVLGELAQANGVLLVAFFGGLGALFGDYIIYRFMKDRIAADFDFLLEHRMERLKGIFRRKIFRWMVPFLGALIVASPFPDELGIAMMGIFKVKPGYFIPLSFFLNAAGILIIGLIAKTII
ncbi:MAG: hypothetical protein AAB731_05415 [Patescibacteria group bacterium]